MPNGWKSTQLLPTHTIVTMKALPSPFPIFAPQSRNLYFLHLNSHLLKLKSFSISSSSSKAASVVPPPPPNFNFKNEILDISTAAIAETHPELLDLAKNGTLVLINKTQYGPVPPWRSEFVEPEAIWIIGTTHISPESASDVERVISVVRPDNVVVELCRSRQVFSFSSGFVFLMFTLIPTFRILDYVICRSPCQCPHIVVSMFPSNQEFYVLIYCFHRWLRSLEAL